MFHAIGPINWNGWFRKPLKPERTFFQFSKSVEKELPRPCQNRMSPITFGPSHTSWARESEEVSRSSGGGSNCCQNGDRHRWKM